MGAGPSKDEQLYNAVQSNNHNAVKALHREGASLEWVDKEGRTPLILACTRGDLFDMVILLLSLGANSNVYRPGAHGGLPLHHAAKRGLDKTVLLLLRNGADPLAINDDGLSPLDMARAREHVTIVRRIEDKICLFSGFVREQSGPGFLEVIAPQWVTKKVWAVVLPAETPDPRRPPKFDLVIYQSPKVSLWNGVNATPSSHPAGPCNVAVPRTVLHLSKCEIEEPKFSTASPQLLITERSTKTKHKFLSEMEGDKAQLERFWMACKGIQQARIPGHSQHPPPPAASVQGPPQIQGPRIPSNTARPVPAPVKPSGQTSAGPGLGVKLAPDPQSQMTEDVALSMAIDASLRTASEEGFPLSPSAFRQSLDSNGWGDTAESSYSGWGPPESKKASPPSRTSYGGWEAEKQSAYNGWASPEETGPGRRGSGDALPHVPETVQEALPHVPGTVQEAHHVDSSGTRIHSSAASPPAPVSSPSAPPLPSHYMPPAEYDGPIHYPSIDTSPVKVDYTPIVGAVDKVPDESAKKIEQEKAGGLCVVCWDLPAVGVCIPCGHLAGCMDCLSEIKEKNWGCPVCRAPIDQIVRVFQV